MGAIDGYENLRYPAEPAPWTLKEIRDKIPARLHQKSTIKSMLYASRVIILSFVFFALALQINPFFESEVANEYLDPTVNKILRTACWLAYWWFQGLALTGYWVVAHECGHGAFSDSRLICHSIGWVLHSLVLTPYFSWKLSHHHHHSYHGSMEKEEAYVPRTRTQRGIPANLRGKELKEYLEDSPIYTLCSLIQQQLFGLDAYFFFNVSGRSGHPIPWTNHFNPNSVLFHESQFTNIVISDVGIIAALALLYRATQLYGFMNLFVYYGIPWMQVNHWIVMITYLHHTDPILPHFRAGSWNYARGASATIDRDFLGWQGRIFFYDVAHYHVVHHFFPRMPWYNCEEATKYLREVIGPYYLHTSKPVFKTLWDNFSFCWFVDDEGEIIYYRNSEGKTVQELDAALEAKAM